MWIIFMVLLKQRGVYQLYLKLLSDISIEIPCISYCYSIDWDVKWENCVLLQALPLFSIGSDEAIK